MQPGPVSSPGHRFTAGQGHDIPPYGEGSAKLRTPRKTQTIRTNHNMCKSAEDRQAAIDSLIRHHKDIVAQLTTALVTEIGKILRRDGAVSMEIPAAPSGGEGAPLCGVESAGGRLVLVSVRPDGTLERVVAEQAGLPMLIEAYERLR